VESIAGQEFIEWSFKPQWLHLILLRQNLDVWPKRKQLLHCTGERTLGEILKIMLYIDKESGILGDKNLISTTRVGDIELSFLVEMRLNAMA